VRTLSQSPCQMRFLWVFPSKEEEEEVVVVVEEEEEQK